MSSIIFGLSVLAHLVSGLKSNGTFQSLGETIAYDLYTPSSNASGPIPIIVAAPGFPSVKELFFPPYGEALSDAGIALLVMDYIGFGESTGKQRQDVIIKQQHITYKDGIDLVAKDSRFDPERIGAFGKSLSGAHTIHVTATDDRIKAAAAIVPHIKANKNTVEQRLQFVNDITADMNAKSTGGKRIMVPVFGPTGSKAVMTTDGAAEYLGPQIGKSNYINEATACSMLEIASYDVSDKAKAMRKPILIITGMQDTITPSNTVLEAFAGVESADIFTLHGEHFTVTEWWKEAIVQTTIKWFQNHL